MSVKKISVIVFPGGTNLPLWAGMEAGFFHRQGLEIEVHPTRSSIEQLTGLIDGKWDIGLTGFDNVVAYVEGQGEAPVEGPVDLFSFMGGDDAFLRVVVQGAIQSYDDLKGKQLSVDALTTGFAFVLREMVERAGLGDDDVEYVKVGGLMQRWEALKNGDHAGTLLLTPFEILAELAGLRELQSASEVFPHYQGLLGTTRKSWAKDHPDELSGFIRGYLDALDWLFDTANRAAACDLLVANIPNMTQAVAERTCGVLLAAEGGFARAAEIDWKGVDTVLTLRSKYGLPSKQLNEPGKYFDLSYYETAQSMA